MTLATQILRAPHIGVRDLKIHLSEKVKGDKPLVVTDHGDPKQVMIPYHVIVEIAELLEELNDAELMRAVKLSRSASEKGERGSSATGLFAKIKKQRK